VNGHDLGNWASVEVGRLIVLAFVAGVFCGVCLLGTALVFLP
jgi:hypothetical protein